MGTMGVQASDQNADIEMGGVRVMPGERRVIQLALPRLYTHAEMTMPVQVLHGEAPGPCLLLCAALHGDELNGIEIIRQTMKGLTPEELRGTVIAAPIVNVFGFIYESRYLPDRRDLNRSFPGYKEGSLASRLADLLMTEVVSHCSHIIDLHTGSLHRANLPQVRGDLSDPETRRCAEAFAAPFMMHAATRDGSLREAAVKQGVSVLVYEGGEPHRFNRSAIEVGVEGIMRVMVVLGMLDEALPPATPSIEGQLTRWVRAHQSGIFRLNVVLGEIVRRGQMLGVISDVFGENARAVRAPMPGMVVGLSNDPRAHRGDALVHLAEMEED